MTRRGSARLMLLLALSLIAVACASSATDRAVTGPPQTQPGIESGPTIIVELLVLEDETTDNDVAGYLDDLEPMISTFDGEWLGPPIEIIDPLLDNPALPTSAEPLDEHLLVLTGFPTAAMAQEYLHDSDVAAVRDRHATAVVTQLQAVGAGSFGLPLPGSQASRPQPAFYLLNMLPQQNSDQQAQFLDYVTQASPLAGSVGTAFFDGIAFSEVVVGETSFATMGLTEWTSLETFHDLHADPDFLELAEQRNATLDRFIEAAGRARPDLVRPRS